MTRIKLPLPPLKLPQWPEWLDRRTLILLIIATIFLMTLTWSEPLQQPNQPESSLAAGATLSPSPENTSSLPPEWEHNSEQTNGILLGGVILVLIIVIGSYSVMRRKT
ncbi:MAG: hypothetical protein HPY59_04355 [Anaerolineae bacterium]|nr:hypothetical protein [Anaerolineae bacterium]